MINFIDVLIQIQFRLTRHFGILGQKDLSLAFHGLPLIFFRRRIVASCRFDSGFWGEKFRG